MSNKATAAIAAAKSASDAIAVAKRNASGQFMPGASGYPGGSASRARRDLNSDTVKEMHRAFREGGREAILKVMKQQPAVFLKLLVLLVPRELEVTHSAGVKAMTDEQIEQAIETISEMLARREAGENATVIDGETLPVPASPGEVEVSQVVRKRGRPRKAAQAVTPALPDDDTPSE